MARDLLTVQASTVASESAFSISGRIISERRSRLTPESVEVCVCLKDYLDGVDRVQHETSLEGPILEDVEETIAREEVELDSSSVSQGTTFKAVVQSNMTNLPEISRSSRMILIEMIAGTWLLWSCVFRLYHEVMAIFIVKNYLVLQDNISSIIIQIIYKES
ncbi:zinc finger BED domain-containing protein RICESLEEPER 2 [Tanacetum coccineum]